MPKTHFMEAGGTSDQPLTAPRYLLAATLISHRTFIVARVSAATKRPLSERNTDCVPWEIFAEPLSSGSDQLIRTAEPIHLPDWGSADWNLAAPERAELRDSTLIFLDNDAGLQFDYAHSLHFTRLGVSALVWRDPFIQDHNHVLHLRRQSAVGKIRTAAAAWRGRTAVLAHRGWMKRILRARSFAVTPHGCVSERLAKLSAKADENLFADYALFEGMRQLPPGHFSLADIATKGGGRYAIWNQTCCFSPTDKDRLESRPYILVKRTPAIDRHLAMNLEVHVSQPHDPEATEALTRHIDCQAGERDVGLRPGDRIIVATHGLPPGGAERQWVYLAQTLAAQGYDVTFVVDDLEGPNAHYAPMLEGSKIPIVAAAAISTVDQLRSWPRTPTSWALLKSGIVPERTKLVRLTAVIRMLAPKVMFVQLDEMNIIGGLAGLIAEVPRIVLSFRNLNPTTMPYLNVPWFLPAYRLLARSARIRLSGNSRLANDDYARWIGIAPERVAHIPNAIDPAAFPVPSTMNVDRLRSSLNVTEGSPILLGVFRLSEEKDPLTFVEVCRRVADQMPELRAFIAGIGPLRQAVVDRIEQLGLQHNLQLLGLRSDVNVLLKAADVLLLASVQEGMPNVAMEAQLLGTPVVATMTGATPDTILPGKSGLLRPVGDVSGLAEDCLRLLRDRALASQMGEAGRHLALTTFALDLHARRHLEVAMT